MAARMTGMLGESGGANFKMGRAPPAEKDPSFALYLLVFWSLRRDLFAL
jgi:hypothetical protein